VLRSHLQKRYSIVFFDATVASLNQDLPPVLDVDALPGGQSGEAAAGEGRPFTIYGIAICRFIGWGGDGGGKRNMIEFCQIFVRIKDLIP